jgi:glutathione-regulated potassium-efflux system ancillary protein KefG
MAKVLVLFAHPALEKSRVHAALIKGIRKLPGISFHDLYESYPDFDIDVEKEKELLLQHDIIVLQHPFYWYSAPAIIKQWLDLVLEHNWAYGSQGNQLQGKVMLNVISSGGRREAYSREGRNRFSYKELLIPFELTAKLCKMQYWPPFVVHGTHRLEAEGISNFTAQYHQLLLMMANDQLTEEAFAGSDWLNDIMPLQIIQS